MNTDLALEDVVVAGLAFPEGPCWTVDGTLVLVDLAQRRVLELVDGGLRELATLPGSPNGAALTPGGRILVADNGGHWPPTASTGDAGGPGDRPGRLVAVGRDGLVETVLDRIDGESLDAPNDLCVDSAGGVWFTDPHWGTTAVEAPHHGAVGYLAADGTARRCATGLQFPNGVCLSPDERWLYVAETRTGHILRAELHGPGDAGPLTPWARLGADQSVDGMCVDEAGTLLVAASSGGAVFVVDPRDPGHPTTIASADPVVTNLCFGDDDLRTLYVTEGSLGRVTRLRWPVPGAPLPDRKAHP